MRTYTGKIKSIRPGQIFVFGSNTQGRHGKGAAKFAYDKCGAIYGRAYGIQGNSYAIVTKDLTKKYHPSISTNEIQSQIVELYRYADHHSDLTFFVAYSGAGTNLNGYTSDQMAKMFATRSIPDNIVFESRFALLVAKYIEK